MSDDDGTPPESKLTRSKQRWAAEGRFLTGRTARPGEERLPPGQHLTRDWPVLDLAGPPSINRAHWRLDVGGAVRRPLSWDWAELMAQPQESRTTDIHCVTTWSRYDNVWQGVSTRHLLETVDPKDEAGFVVLHSHDGYTTNLTLADFASDDALLVHSWNGAPLTADHGAPLRLVVPHLYFWKSAKWLSAITVLNADSPGYWEVRGYHNRGDPWAEERYSDD
jgi:DMSO/TMAO reductase YedYZ molybdopterin-dependent catalytic subunit